MNLKMGTYPVFGIGDVYRFLQGAFCAVLAAGMALHPVDAAAGPYTSAVTYTWADGQGNSDADIESQDSTFAEYSDLNGASRARAGYGVNGVYAEAVFAMSSGYSAQSIWSDDFVVVGGSGQGTAKVSVTLSGETQDLYTGIMYGLYVSYTGFDEQLFYNGLDGDHRIFGTTNLVWERHDDVQGQTWPGPLYKTFVLDVPFVYEQGFSLLSILDGSAWGSGKADFWHSANFGISVPQGASLSALSGMSYVAAVPEPQSYALLLAGLGLLVFVARRRRG